MRQKISKLIGVVVVVLSILSIAPVIVPATTYYSWYGYADTPGTNIKSGVLTKQTTSSALANYNLGGASPRVMVKIYANISGSYTNVTYGGPYYVTRSNADFIEVQNLALENNGYNPVNTYALFITTTTGTHNGRWAADE